MEHEFKIAAFIQGIIYPSVADKDLNAIKTARFTSIILGLFPPLGEICDFAVLK